MSQAKALSFTQDSLNSCCGVDDVGSFHLLSSVEKSYWHRTTMNNRPSEVRRPGADMFVSTFINTEECKEAYECLTKKHTLLYQSPVKRNRNSGRSLFLCVFMYRQP